MQTVASLIGWRTKQLMKDSNKILSALSEWSQIEHADSWQPIWGVARPKMCVLKTIPFGPGVIWSIFGVVCMVTSG